MDLCDCSGKCHCAWEYAMKNGSTKIHNILSIGGFQYKDVVQLGQYIFDENIPKRTESFTEARFWYKQKQQISGGMNSFISKVANVLLKNGFRIDVNTYHLELHSYTINNENCDSCFGWHEDDYGGVDFPVNTMILYLRKDEDIHGGNLFYYQDSSKHIIVTKSETMVLMDGRVIHKAENIYGTGSRDSIVIQFMRI